MLSTISHVSLVKPICFQSFRKEFYFSPIPFDFLDLFFHSIACSEPTNIEQAAQKNVKKDHTEIRSDSPSSVKEGKEGRGGRRDGVGFGAICMAKRCCNGEFLLFQT